MILEHSIVTTASFEQVDAAARELVTEMGFRLAPSQEGGWISASHGLEKRPRIRSPHNCPKALWLEFDRQRVMIGATLAAPANGKYKVEESLLMAIAGAIEARLAHNASIMDASRIWKDALDSARRATIRNRIGFAVTFAILAGVTVWLVRAVMR